MAQRNEYSAQQETFTASRRNVGTARNINDDFHCFSAGENKLYFWKINTHVSNEAELVNLKFTKNNVRVLVHI
jgi:hypothetical protein